MNEKINFKENEFGYIEYKSKNPYEFYQIFNELEISPNDKNINVFHDNLSTNKWYKDKIFDLKKNWCIGCCSRKLQKFSKMTAASPA